MFERRCYIKRNKKKLGKFDPRADEGIFRGYSHNSKGCRCYNKNTKRIVNCIDVKVENILIFKKILSNNLGNNNTKDDETFLDEDIKEVLNP